MQQSVDEGQIEGEGVGSNLWAKVVIVIPVIVTKGCNYMNYE